MNVKKHTMRTSVISVLLTTSGLMLMSGKQASAFEMEYVHIPNDAATIQEGILLVEEGGTVAISAGIWVEQLDTNGKAFTLFGIEGPESTIIDGSLFGSVITCSSGEEDTTIIKNVTVIGGTGTDLGTSNGGTWGGGILCNNSSPLIDGCIFEGNAARMGGAIAVYKNSSPRIIDCVFLSNTVSGTPNGYGGAIHCRDGGHTIITNSLFVGNVADGTHDGYGGAIMYWDSDVEVISCCFTDNSALGGIVRGVGGAIAGFEGNATIQNSVFSYNNAENEGESLWLNPTASSASVQGSSFCGAIIEQISGDWKMGTDNDFYDSCSYDCNDNGVVDSVDLWSGISLDIDLNGTPDECDCLADIDGTGNVDVLDLLLVIARWEQPGPLGDIDFSGNIDVSDLLYVINSWGECP